MGIFTAVSVLVAISVVALTGAFEFQPTKFQNSDNPLCQTVLYTLSILAHLPGADAATSRYDVNTIPNYARHMYWTVAYNKRYSSVWSTMATSPLASQQLNNFFTEMLKTVGAYPETATYVREIRLLQAFLRSHKFELEAATTRVESGTPTVHERIDEAIGLTLNVLGSLDDASSKVKLSIQHILIAIATNDVCIQVSYKENDAKDFKNASEQLMAVLVSYSACLKGSPYGLLPEYNDAIDTINYLKSRTSQIDALLDPSKGEFIPGRK